MLTTSDGTSDEGPGGWVHVNVWLLFVISMLLALRLFGFSPLSWQISKKANFLEMKSPKSLFIFEGLTEGCSRTSCS